MTHGGHVDANIQVAGTSRHKYIVFFLHAEKYGIQVDFVSQLIAMPKIRPIPATQDYVKGVVNLRGKIIPVIDIRLKFEIPFDDYTERTSIIVLRPASDSDLQPLGLIVDQMDEVVDIHDNQIDTLPPLHATVNPADVAGIAKINSQVITLLNTFSLLNDEAFVDLPLNYTTTES